MAEIKERLDRDELIKSLQELDFKQEDIDQIVEKAEKNGDFGDKKEEPALKKEEGKDKEDETVDEKAVEAADDKDDMKKAYDKIMSAKGELEKSMTEFLDKFGSVPGMKTLDTDLTHKAIETDLEKSEVNDFEKAFGGKFELIEKSLSDFSVNQNKINDELVKAITSINENVNAIAQAPNPFKSILGNYTNSILEKGEKMNEAGKRVISLRNKELATEEFAKSIDVIADDKDKQIVRDMICDYTVAGKTSTTGLNIVKKALNIEFEK